jgi:beta-glucosidase
MKVNPIILGVSSYILTNQERDFFIKANPFGFILFKRNIQSKEQIKLLVAELKSLVSNENVYIFIDEEGGRVSRLESAGIIPKGSFPPAFSFYELYQKEGIIKAKDAVYENYFRIGTALAELGINGNFAPVADLFYEDAHMVIGNRSFGPQVEVVVELCSSAIDGLQTAGVEACIKHIPGHGLAKVDSHIGVPRIDKQLDFLEKRDFAVFRDLSAKSNFAMTAHVIYDCLDPENPVTISQQAIRYVRNQIGFSGCIITDGIEMAALGDDVVKSAKMAFQAGCDIVLYAASEIKVAEQFLKIF